MSQLGRKSLYGKDAQNFDKIEKITDRRQQNTKLGDAIEMVRDKKREFSNQFYE